jgi:hypothetical protein
MLKDCKQEPRKGQQHKGKQLRVTAEFCATRGAYDTTGAMTPKSMKAQMVIGLLKT